MSDLTKEDAVTAALLVVSLYAYLTAATNTELGLWQFVFFSTVGVIGLIVTLCRVWPFISRKRYEELKNCMYWWELECQTQFAKVLTLQDELAKYKRPRNEKGQFVKQEEA